MVRRTEKAGRERGMPPVASELETRWILQKGSGKRTEEGGKSIMDGFAVEEEE